MPIIRSSSKDVRRTKRRTERNRAARSKVRTAVKSVHKALGTPEAAQKLQAAQKIIDKAKSSGVLKKNTAARLVGRLSRKVHAKAARADGNNPGGKTE